MACGFGFFLLSGSSVPLGGRVRVHHPSCVHPGADRVQSTQRFLLHRRPAPRYSFLNPKHLGRCSLLSFPSLSFQGPKKGKKKERERTAEEDGRWKISVMMEEPPVEEKKNIRGKINVQSAFILQGCFSIAGGSAAKSRVTLARGNPVHRSCLPLQSVRCEQFSKCCT